MGTRRVVTFSRWLARDFQKRRVTRARTLTAAPLMANLEERERAMTYGMGEV